MHKHTNKNITIQLVQRPTYDATSITQGTTLIVVAFCVCAHTLNATTNDDDGDARLCRS